jgi:hypothetical protein
MADLSAFQLPDAHAIQQRNQQMRQQQWASGNPMAMQQATTQNALDALFGNPEEQRAKKIQTVLSKAQQDVKPADGDTDVDTELRRLRSMRDAVGDIDPTVSSQINTRMLQLGQVKLEQDKLYAEERRANNKDIRENVTTVADLASKEQNLAQDKSEAQNYWRKGANGIERRSILKTDAVTRAQMRDPAAGWVEGDGPKTEAEASNLLDKKTKGTLESAVISGRNLMSTFTQIQNKFDPSFLTLPTQLMMGGNRWSEKLTGQSISPDIAAKAKNYYEFKSTAVDALNRYINLITGAAMGKEEEHRIRNAFPDAENDSPQEFQSKLRSTMRSVLSTQRRAEQALSAGLGQWDGEKLSQLSLPAIDDKELDAAMQQAYGTTGRESQGVAPTMQPKASKPDADGWIKMPNGSRVKEIK